MVFLLFGCANQEGVEVEFSEVKVENAILTYTLKAENEDQYCTYQDIDVKVEITLDNDNAFGVYEDVVNIGKLKPKKSKEYTESVNVYNDYSITKAIVTGVSEGSCTNKPTLAF